MTESKRIDIPGLLSRDAFSDLVICIAGHYISVQNHRQKRDVVEEYQIAYCVQGAGSITSCGRTVAVSKGSVFINVPGFAHEYHANPNDPWTLGAKGLVLGRVGRHDDAIACIERALRLDPFYPDWMFDILAFEFYAKRRYAEAIDVVRKMKQPPHWICPWAR